MINIKLVFFKLLFLILTGIISYSFSFLPESSQLRYEDRIRIKEAENIANQYSNSVWENWNSVPFTFLFISADSEYLIGYKYEPEGFIDDGFDTILTSEIYSRKRTYDTRMFAAFMAVDTVTTIVVGTPENTGYSGSRWIITLLHEHFHQYQYLFPDYNQSVKALDLMGKDNSGMWMLNYPFPYENDTIVNEYNLLAQLAKKTAFTKDIDEFSSLLKSFREEQKKFKSLLNDKDYSYISFQLWQEGIARYTEYKITRTIMNTYKPSDEAKKLKDYIPYDSLYKNMMISLSDEVDKVKLNKEKRVCFYSLGALVGLILDRANPNWHDLYFKEKFYLEKYF